MRFNSEFKNYKVDKENTEKMLPPITNAAVLCTSKINQ
jgi:hypothetical protein